MEAKPPVRPLQERALDLKAATLRYLVREGEGPTLVLVHGFGGAGSNWDALFPHLDPNRRLIVPDLPGHGLSSPLPALPSLGPFAERLALLLDREDAWPTVAVGHSMGRSSRCGWRGSGRRVRRGACPRRRRRGELCDRARAPLPDDRRLRAARPAYRQAARAVAQSARLRSAVFGYWGAADPPALSPEAVEGLLAGSALHTDLTSVVPALVLDDPRRDLEGVRCPTLLLWGARDRQTPVSDAFDYARRLHAELRVIPDCGHLLIAERPDACAHALHDVAERVGARAPAAAA
jgi:magnesium chelatase accessory protein